MLCGGIGDNVSLEQDRSLRILIEDGVGTERGDEVLIRRLRLLD